MTLPEAAVSGSQDPCRVLHVLGRMQRGGAELRTLEVLRQLAPHGITGDVLALSGEVGELDGEIARLGGLVIPLKRGTGFLRRLRGVMTAGGYSAVHSHVHHYSGVLLRAARKAGIPVRVAQFHSLDDGRGRGLPRRLYHWWMRRLIAEHATSILGVSRSVLAANWPGHATDDRCRVIYNGIDDAAFARARPRDEVRAEILGVDHASCRVIIHVGNLTPPKNHDLLLATFEEVARGHGDVHLVLVGRGDAVAEEQLRKRIASSAYAQRLHFLGGRDDVPSLLLAADAFLFPSLREGLPGALVEACAAGLPCLASDIGPCREVAEGIPLVRLQDKTASPERWAAALVNLMHRAVRMPTQEAVGLVHAAGFSLATASKRYADLWRGGGK
jgi:glycosyltransferase involved in cell wall biosynthesis